MTHLTKLTFKTVDRSVKRDPITARREKLVAGLKEQKLVHAATLKKQDHLVERHKWMQNDMVNVCWSKLIVAFVLGSLHKTGAGMCSAAMERV
jgi:hypothetical protein